MTKLSFIYIALISSLAFISLAQDCSNPLLGAFNLASLDTPQSGSNVPYCSNLQAGSTCCSADVVSTFQNQTNTLIDNLNNYAAGRDLYLAQLNTRYFATFNSILQNISNNNAGDLTNITTLNATLGGILQDIINNATQASNNAQNVSSNFSAELATLQTLRTTCLDTALEVQTSAWCLACDPNYATEGVASDDTITFSDGLCQAISDACWPYLNQNAVFNPLFTARKWYWDLLSVKNYLANYTTNGSLNSFGIAQDPYNPLGSQDSSVVPPLWTGDGNTGAPAQCQDLWAGDNLLQMLLNIGAGEAAIGETGNEENVIPFEEETVFSNEEDNIESESQTVTVTVNTNTNTNNRLLQDIVGDDGTWVPDLTGTGLDFSNVRNDPADYFGL